MLRALPPRWGDEDLFHLYQKLADCHRDNQAFSLAS